MSATILVGGYGPDMGGEGSGIVRLHVDDDGALTSDGLVATLPSPSWLVVEGDRLYAALEGDAELATLAVAVGATDAASRIDAEQLGLGDGGAEGVIELARAETGGEAVCHLALGHGLAYASAYASGSVSRHRLRDRVAPDLDLELELQAVGGRPRPEQDAPHAHTTLIWSETVILVADLGSDRVVLIHPRGDEEWISLEFPPGTGPRDLLRLDDGTVLVLGELDGTVHRIRIEPELEVIETVELLGAVDGDHAAALALHEASGVVHVGLRGSNRVSRVHLAPASVPSAARLSGLDAVEGQGSWPRHVLVVDDLLLVADQLSNSVSAYRLDATGVAAPHPLGSVAVPSPTHLVRVDDTPWASVATRR
ncbi:lactonase family protein [Schumannella soli]|uniref:Lactonase family protein n=1 Tax=Schumannella soli TaxID=2590779 RepID=A0A506Y2A8_9MICO|nr:beta-propeller fold lactonase family protein [Schumannella soli]TPW76112.1 lactonase family protein [Schumannella soli]